MRFPDREMAERQLAAKLTHLKDAQPLVLALPHGGVAVGFEICPGARRAAQPSVFCFYSLYARACA